MEILICTVADRKYGFQLSAIKRVILSVEVSPIPDAPPQISGAINVHGNIMPVVNMRHIFGSPSKELEVSDRFILCHAKGQELALWVDKVLKVVRFSESELIPAKSILPEFASFEFVLKDSDEIVLLYDLEKIKTSIEATGVRG